MDNQLSNGESGRLEELERIIARYETEITTLKTTLQDIVKRVSAIEASKQVSSNRPTHNWRKSSNTRHSLAGPLKSVHSHENLNSTTFIAPRPLTSHSSVGGKSRKQLKSDLVSSNNEAAIKLQLRGRTLNFYTPDDLDTTKVEQSDSKLRLNWVHGYRGKDCRNNLHALPTGELVYFVAAVVVLFNPEDQMQRFYTEHTDDVKCIAIHPDRFHVATGQVTSQRRRTVGLGAHVRIWESLSLQTLCVIGLDDFERGVCCLAFSKQDGGSLLCCVDDSNDHVLSVWDWTNQRKLAENKCSKEPIVQVEFHRIHAGTIFSCGKNHLGLWKYDSGSLAKKMLTFGTHEKPKFILCLAFSLDGDLLTGDSNGTIFIWDNEKFEIVRSLVEAHDGPIFALNVAEDGLLMSGGGKDRKLVTWNTNFEVKTSVNELSELQGAVRTIARGAKGQIFVGTTRNSVVLSGEEDFRTIIQGHTDELWGLACHPTQQQFITAGKDKLIACWDSLSASCIWSKELQEAACCVCYNPSGSFFCVGTYSGRWLVLDVSSRSIVFSLVNGREKISTVQFSPDGTLLAIASHDNSVYVYRVSNDFKRYSRLGVCTGHSSFVTHIDWSQDGSYLRSNSGDHELLFWLASSCKQVKQASTLRNLLWASHSCVFSYGTVGIWTDGCDGTDINACCIGHGCNVLASADDFGHVNLYEYPCLSVKGARSTYGGHSSHVTNVNFLCNDSRLISTGGLDTAVIQWEVIRAPGSRVTTPVSLAVDEVPC